MEKRKSHDFDEIIDGKERLYCSNRRVGNNSLSGAASQKFSTKQTEEELVFLEPVYVGEASVKSGGITNFTNMSVDSEKKPTNSNPRRRAILKEIGIYIALIIVCIYIIPTYVVQRTLVDGPSMENALFDKENVLVDKISYHVRDPKRFEIVVFYPQGDDAGDYYVKRIIGLPGETVQILDGSIYIDGTKLEEDYGKNSLIKAGIAAEPIQLGEDEYFVLGDNRLVSKDSRYSSVGLVKRKDIEGRVWIRIWPLEDFGKVE